MDNNLTNIYEYQVVSDTPYFTIVKYTINGEITDNIICLDTQSLACSTLSSSYDQLGIGYPRLNSIYDINASINKESSIKKCKEQEQVNRGVKNYNSNCKYICGSDDIDQLPPYSIPNINEIDFINDKKSIELSSLGVYRNLSYISVVNVDGNIPFNVTQNDLVGFYPNHDYKNPLNTTYYGNTVEDIETIIFGLAQNSKGDKSNYIIFNVETLTELIKILEQMPIKINFGVENNTRVNSFLMKYTNTFIPNYILENALGNFNNSYETFGKWKYNGSFNYKYFIEKICVDSMKTSFSYNLSQSEETLNTIIEMIEKTSISGLSFKLKTINNLNYSIFIEKFLLYRMKVIVSEPHNILDNLENICLLDSYKNLGRWSIKCGSEYEFQINSRNIFLNGIYLHSFLNLILKNGFIPYKNSVIYKKYIDNDPLSILFNFVKIIVFPEKETSKVQLITSNITYPILENILNSNNIEYRVINQYNPTDLSVNIEQLNKYETILYSHNKLILEKITHSFKIDNLKELQISNIIPFEMKGIYLNDLIIPRNYFIQELKRIGYRLSFFSDRILAYKPTLVFSDKNNINQLINIDTKLEVKNNIKRYLIYGDQKVIKDILNKIKKNGKLIINRRQVPWDNFYIPYGSIIIQPDEDKFIIQSSKKILESIYSKNKEFFEPVKYSCYKIYTLYINIDEFYKVLTTGEWTILNYYLGNILTYRTDTSIRIYFNGDLSDSDDEQVIFYGTPNSVTKFIGTFKKLNLSYSIKELIPANRSISVFQISNYTIGNRIENIKNRFQVLSDKVTIDNFIKNLNVSNIDAFEILPFNLNSLNINILLENFITFITTLSIFVPKYNFYLNFKIDSSQNLNNTCINTSYYRLFITYNKEVQPFRNKNSVNLGNVESELVTPFNDFDLITKNLSSNKYINPLNIDDNLFYQIPDKIEIDLGNILPSMKGTTGIVSGINIKTIPGFIPAIDSDAKYLATPIFLQIVNLGNKIQIIADQSLLSFFENLMKVIGINVVPAGTYQLKISDNLAYRPPVPMGRITGLSNGPKKNITNALSNNPFVAIQTVTWNLRATELSEGIVQFFWEANQNSENEFSNYIAFQCTESGSYGVNGLSGGGFQLNDNSGEPPIANNAFNPTGNIIMRTIGKVHGQIIIKYLKTVNWFNNFNEMILPGPINNVFASIQAQDLQNRVLSQAIVNRNEEAYFLPKLYQLELKNRYPNRPSNSNPVMITNRIIGVIMVDIPPLILENLGINEIDRSIWNYLLTNININQKKWSKKIIQKPNANNNYKYAVEFNIYFPPIQPKSYLYGNVPLIKLINDTCRKIGELDDGFIYKISKFPILKSLTNFRIIHRCISKIINLPSKNGRQGTEGVGDLGLSRFLQSEARILQHILSIDGQQRFGGSVGINVTNGSYDTGYDPRSIHHISGVNTNNITKWLDTVVKMTIQGSEFPIPILYPKKKGGKFTFTDGTPIDGFLLNAFGTGINIPVPPKPKINKNPSVPQYNSFSNMKVKNRQRVRTGGNVTIIR